MAIEDAPWVPAYITPPTHIVTCAPFSLNLTLPVPSSDMANPSSPAKKESRTFKFARPTLHNEGAFASAIGTDCEFAPLTRGYCD